MKRKSLAFFSVVWLLAILFCSCTPNGSKNPSGETAEIPEKEVVLFGGDADYRIVYSDAAGRMASAVVGVKVPSAVIFAAGRM